MPQEHKKSFIINVLFYASFILLIIVGFKFFVGYLVPFAAAFLVGFLAQKPASFLSEKIKIKKEIFAAIVAFLIFVLSVSLLVFLVCFFALQLRDLFLDLPEKLQYFLDIFTSLQEKWVSLIESLSPEFANISEEMLGGVLKDILTKSATLLTDFITNAIKNAPTFLFTAIISLVAGCYIAKDYAKLLKFIRNLGGERFYNNAVTIKDIAAKSVFKMLKGYLLLCLVVFFVLLLGFLSLGIDYALVLAAVIALIDLLPVFGTGTVLVPWGLIEISLGENRGFLILLVYLAVVVVRNLLEPKIIGTQIGINPLFTLFIMFIGLKAAGILGLFSFPLIFIVMFKYYKRELDLEKQN